MEEIVWIEILSRHRDVATRQRCRGPVVRVGRAYDNDVVIDDPYIAPYHLRIARDADGQLVAEDLGSLNGLFVDRDRARRTQIVLEGDRPIRIGGTLLRVRDGGQPVPPERALPMDTRLWPRAAVLVALVIVAYLGSQWLNESGEPKPSRYLSALLILPLWAAGWSGCWAIASRIFIGQARFERHLLIGLWGALANWAWSTAASIVGFGLSWPSLIGYREIGLWCIVGAVVFFHLRVFGPQRLWLKGLAGAAVTVIALTLLVANQLDTLGRSDDQRLMQNFMPPIFRLTAPTEDAAFFTDVGRIKAKLDRDRLEEAPVATTPDDD